MNNFIFENKTKIYFGKGCVKEYLACLVKKQEGNIMLCYGEGSIKKNGIYEEVSEILASAGKAVFEFSGIMPNPTYNKVLEGAELARKHQIGLILGVGGGSVMDCCKAISMAARYDGDVWENFWESPGMIDFEPLPLGVIVTVAGTGSFDTLSHVMEIYFSRPDEENVSDDLAEALMKNIIRNLRAAIRHPEDYTARSNLMWDAAMAENRIIKLGKRTDFQCHQMEHQLGAYTDCNHGAGLAVLHPAYYRHIYKDGLAKFSRFAENVWGIPAEGQSEEEIARAGVEALADFIREIGLPVTLRELGIDKGTDLKEVADSCALVSGGYKKMTHDEIYQILQEAM